MNTKHLLLTLSFVLGTASVAACQTTARVTTPAPQATTTRAGETNAAPLLGKWQGSYQGSGTGKFEIGLSQNAGAAPTGYVAIQPEGAPEFPSIPFDSVTLEGNTVKATFTDWEGNPAHVEGTLEKDELTGTWKTGGGQGGTWKTAKVN
ncbi:MAG: hypothetical protein ICV83_16010 [Cytophagales bacterium]|nr:hypothetical protein [Cytophagales bacterium]